MAFSNNEKALSYFLKTNRKRGDSSKKNSIKRNVMKLGTAAQRRRARQFPEEKESRKMYARRQVINSPNVQKIEVKINILPRTVVGLISIR